MVLAMMLAEHNAADLVVLLVTAMVVVAAGLPLARHLWASPANAPDHLPHRSGEQEMTPLPHDRFSTRWGGGWIERKDAQ